MKKIAWCVPLSFVTAVIFLLGNAAPAQAGLICGYTAISIGANEYIYTWSCYENGLGEGREDVKYGTHPRDGGGGGGTSISTKEAAQSVVDRYVPICKQPQESYDNYSARLQADCVKTSVALAIDENPIIARTPFATGFLTTEVTKFCAIKVNELLGSGQVNNC